MRVLSNPSRRGVTLHTSQVRAVRVGGGGVHHLRAGHVFVQVERRGRVPGDVQRRCVGLFHTPQDERV